MKELNSSVISKKLEHSEFKMAAMMVCTVTVFVVCNSFHTIYFIMWSQRIVKGETANTLWRMSHNLMTFNCSVIIIIYSIFSKQFRNMFAEQFCGKKNPDVFASNVRLNIIRTEAHTHSSYKWIIMLEKCRHSDLNVLDLK